MKYTFV